MGGLVDRSVDVLSWGRFDLLCKMFPVMTSDHMLYKMEDRLPVTMLIYLFSFCKAFFILVYCLSTRFNAYITSHMIEHSL